MKAVMTVLILAGLFAPTFSWATSLKECLTQVEYAEMSALLTKMIKNKEVEMHGAARANDPELHTKLFLERIQLQNRQVMLEEEKRNCAALD